MKRKGVPLAKAIKWNKNSKGSVKSDIDKFSAYWNSNQANSHPLFPYGYDENDNRLLRIYNWNAYSKSENETENKNEMITNIYNVLQDIIGNEQEVYLIMDPEEPYRDKGDLAKHIFNPLCSIDLSIYESAYEGWDDRLLEYSKIKWSLDEFNYMQNNVVTKESRTISVVSIEKNAIAVFSRSQIFFLLENTSIKNKLCAKYQKYQYLTPTVEYSPDLFNKRIKKFYQTALDAFTDKKKHKALGLLTCFGYDAVKPIIGEIDKILESEHSNDEVFREYLAEALMNIGSLTEFVICEILKLFIKTNSPDKFPKVWMRNLSKFYMLSEFNHELGYRHFDNARKIAKTIIKEQPIL